MNSSIRTILIGVATVLALTACNGSDDTVAPTVPTSAEVTSGVDTTSTTSTSTTSTTSTSTSTTSVSTSTTTPPTTPTTVDATVPTTTEKPEATPESAITDALIEAREAYLYAVYNLDASDANERLALTHAAGSPSLELALDNIQTLIDNGWLARPNPDVPDTVTTESDVVMFDDMTAEVVACVVGAGEVYDPGGNADGSDLIVNGDIEAALNQVTMVFEDGRWKLREGANLSTQEGTRCAVE